MMMDIYEEYSHNKHNGWLQLALAVVKQWVNDGKPRGDARGIQPWIDLIRLHLPEVNIDRIIATASAEQGL